MVTGWRRAFCTSISKDREQKPASEKNHHRREEDDTRSPRVGSKFGFFSLNSSTPRTQSQPSSGSTLRCRTSSSGATTPTTARTPNSSLPNSPRLQCHVISNPSSPKSPSSFSLLKLRILSKTRCGICLQSAKAGHGMATFTAECSHTFHFPCIASQAKKNQGLAVCPVCSAKWKELPLLSVTDEAPIKHKECSKLAGKTLRVYDDDEPLMSPTSGARFNAIPENDDEEGGDGGTEFQGFFLSRPIIDESGRSVEIRLLPESAIVAVGRGYETRAVVMKVKAPSPLTARRSAIDVVAVIDVGAAGKGIHVAKRAMRIVASSLGTNDRLSIVAFSASSKRLLPLRRMTNSGKRSARRIADALGAVAAGGGHGMSVSDAVKKAAKVLEDRRERNPSSTIVLLSDQNQIQIQNQRTEVPVQAISLVDAWTDDALAKRVSCVLSVVVHNFRLELFPKSSMEVAAVYSLLHRPIAIAAGDLSLGDLHAEEEREFLLELRVPTTMSRSHHVLSVRASHREPSSEIISSGERNIVVPRGIAVRSAPPGIERLRSLHVATRAVAESRRLADQSEFAGAHHMLSSARALLLQARSDSGEEFARGLEAELGELHRKMSHRRSRVEEKPEALTPTSAWRAAERLAKVAMMRKSMNRVSDLHGFENARF